ncbi:sialic acid-binding Ig-like lectin 12 isoform X2 [Peromyscus maniculatus bairdii]|uniref:sialic acid-binding Ig-like lectin 12 isoform X2 n=1 Tax=Peromyscus maniculatus bairdii TaxID=230844 RepID=UPI001C2E69F4|nr:sialic acid-binding Ig-like lectin 12 isoform X2 [Peromyscus maniculatus bairdii]
MLVLLLLLWGMKGVEGGPEAVKGYTLSVKKKVVVQEGLCIRVPCTFSYAKKKWTDSDLIHGYWFHSGAKIESDSPVATNNPQRPALKETQGRFFLLGDPQMNDCSLDIRKIRKEDTGSYFFRLEREEEKYSYVQNMMTLHVKDAPKNLTVTIYQGADPEPIILKNGSSLSVSEGQSLRLFCSTDSYPPANLSWTWGNLSLCPSKPSKPGLLELFPVHLKHGGVYTCQAQHALGSQHISLSLHPQRSAALSEMTVGAFVGAGATALFFLFCCIILLVVRSYRRPARPASAAPDPDALKGSVSQSPLVEPQVDDSLEPLPPTVEAAPSSTEEEVHYASLNFHEMKPRNPQGQQDTTTEYSEIKSHK